MKDGKSDGVSVILSQRAKKIKAKKTRNKEDKTGPIDLEKALEDDENPMELDLL